MLLFVSTFQWDPDDVGHLRQLLRGSVQLNH
jgi:hypothetical protein